MDFKVVERYMEVQKERESGGMDLEVVGDTEEVQKE